MSRGTIYFIVSETLEAAKIGFTRSDPRYRLASLQTGNPARLKLYGYVPGTIEEERLLHRAFAPLHIQGEWFRFEGKLRDFVYYLTDCDGRHPAGRDSFENALHDVLMQGMWHPHDPISQDEYRKTGDWEPFRHLLWETHGPWEE